jgi:hypothetical protein
MKSRWNRVWVLSLGCLVASMLVVSNSRGQGTTDLKPYRLESPMPTGDKLTRMLDLQNGKSRVKGPDEKSNKELLQAHAKFIVYRVTHDSYYNLPESGELKPRTPEQNLDSVITDLNGRLLVPTPEGGVSKFSPDQGEYILEFGVALDQAIAAVFAKNPPLIIRVNAARLLSMACKSGAPVHGKMIIAMLQNTYFKDKAGKALETPPEVLYYALKGAENLLAAYDPTVLVGAQATRHSLPEVELVTLVKILEDMVIQGPPVADKAATVPTDLSGKPIAVPVSSDTPMKEPAKDAEAPKTPSVKTLTPEQVAVVRYYRRAAIRALAKVRFDIVGGRGGPEARPAVTLAKVAVSDPSLSLPPTISDIGEAVIGLLGITPTSNLNIDTWAYAIAVGMNAFVKPRLPSDDDKTIPWKMTAARMNVAFTNMKRSIPTNPRLRLAGKPLADLADLVIGDILSALEKDLSAGAGRPTNERLNQWIQANPPKDATRAMYSDNPQFKIVPSGL